MRWTLLLTCACVAPRTAGDALLDGPIAVVATATDDYGAGVLATVTTADWAAQDVATIHGDAVVTVEGEVVWQVNRLQADTVRRYVPGVWDEPVWEASVGRGANPQDVASCGGNLFVSRHEETSLLVLNPETGAERGVVDLEAFADGDGLPEASDLFVEGERLLVVLQRLDRDDGWSPASGGRVVEVDCASWEVTSRVEVGPNPVLAKGPTAVVVAEDGIALLGQAPWWADVDGALFTAAAFGADGRGAFVARDGAQHRIGCLDLEGAPTVLETLPSFVSDVAVHAGQAWFAVRRGWEDPTLAGGLLVVDLDTCEELTTEGWVRSSLAPFSLAFVDP